MTTDISTRPAATADRPGEVRKGGAPRKWRASLGGYAFLAPALILVIGVVYFGIGYNVWLSGYDWDGVSPDREAVGLGNYTEAFSDGVFLGTLRTMAIFSLTIVIQLLLGLVLATLLHSKVKLAGLYKTIVFVPVVIAPAATAPVFRGIFGPDGEFNDLLRSVGLDSITRAWLADPDTALYVLMAVTVWHWTGFAMVLYYANLTQIDPALLEAARIDGAGNRQVFLKIIVPLMRPATLTLAIVGFLGVLKTFDVPYLITGGGPNNATQFLSTYIYQQGVQNFHLGYAAALSVLLLVMAVLFAWWQRRRHADL